MTKFIMWIVIIAFTAILTDNMVVEQKRMEESISHCVENGGFILERRLKKTLCVDKKFILEEL